MEKTDAKMYVAAVEYQRGHNELRHHSRAKSEEQLCTIALLSTLRTKHKNKP